MNIGVTDAALSMARNDRCRPKSEDQTWEISDTLKHNDAALQLRGSP